MDDAQLINGLTVRAGTKDALIAEHASDLGKVPDSEIAERAGVSTRTVAAFRRRQGLHRKRGRAPAVPAPDLPPEKDDPEEAAPVKHRTRGPASKIDPHVHMLGKVADRQIAKLAGVTINAVAAFRRRRGIPAAGRRGASKAPAEVAKVSVAAPAKVAAPAPAKVAAPKVAPVAKAPAPAKVAPAPAPAPTPAKVAPATATVAAGNSVFRVEFADGRIAYAVATGLAGAGAKAEAAGAVSLSFLGPVLG